MIYIFYKYLFQLLKKNMSDPTQGKEDTSNKPPLSYAGALNMSIDQLIAYIKCKNPNLVVQMSNGQIYPAKPDGSDVYIDGGKKPGKIDYIMVAIHASKQPTIKTEPVAPVPIQRQPSPASPIQLPAGVQELLTQLPQVPLPVVQQQQPIIPPVQEKPTVVVVTPSPAPVPEPVIIQPSITPVIQQQQPTQPQQVPPVVIKQEPREEPSPPQPTLAALQQLQQPQSIPIQQPQQVPVPVVPKPKPKVVTPTLPVQQPITTPAPQPAPSPKPIQAPAKELLPEYHGGAFRAEAREYLGDDPEVFAKQKKIDPRTLPSVFDTLPELFGRPKKK